MKSPVWWALAALPFILVGFFGLVLPKANQQHTRSKDNAAVETTVNAEIETPKTEPSRPFYRVKCSFPDGSEQMWEHAWLATGATKIYVLRDRKDNGGHRAADWRKSDELAYFRGNALPECLQWKVYP